MQEMSHHPRRPLFSLYLILVGLMTVASTTFAETTIQQFIKIRWPGSGEMAPDGTLYCIDWPDGINQLYRIDADAGAETARKITQFEDGISGYNLSDDGKWIAMTAAIGGSEQTSLYLRKAGSDEDVTIGDKPDTVFTSPIWRRDSAALAYQANDVVPADFYIYVYDIESKEKTRVLDRPGYHYPIDFNKAGTKLVVGKYMSASYSQLFEITLADKSIREITPEGEEWSFDGVGYSDDEKFFYVVSNYGGDRKQIQRINLANGKVSPVLSDFVDSDVDFGILNQDRTVLAIGVNEDGYRTLHLRSLPELNIIDGPPIDKGIVENVSFTGDWLLFSLNNARTPGIIYKWSLSSPKSDPIALTTAETQGVDVSQFKLPELIHYPSHDGLKIPAFLYLPTNYTKETPIPFLVYYHGGPEGQYRPYFSRSFQYFLTRGIGVLAPNVRGSDGYGTKYLEMDNYKGRMDSVRDGVSAAKWLIKEGYTTPKRVGAWGGSYGGFMVMATITEAPELYGAAANIVGIVNFETFLTLTKDYRRKLREAEYGPLTDTEFLKTISPIYKIDRIQTPLLIAHGLNDPRVPVGEALQLVVGLMKLGRPVEQLIFPDEGHGFAKEENRLLYYAQLADFFERHLKGKAE